jgi:hypothetical protein
MLLIPIVIYSQAAVVRGAAIRGLEGTMPSKLMCRRHYGFTWGLPFKPGIDNESEAFYLFGEKYRAGYMNWLIEKVNFMVLIHRFSRTDQTY